MAASSPFKETEVRICTDRIIFDTPLLTRSGFGYRMHASTDLLAWTADNQMWTVCLRQPESPPWEPTLLVPGPNGPAADLGAAVYLHGDLVPAVRGRPRAVGHSVVEQRGLHTHFWPTPHLSLPETPRHLGARPWPDAPGWAWTDGDTMYRCSPTGNVTVAGRAPGMIGAWDVGPLGAIWFVAAGCLWVAAPGAFARRVRHAVVDEMGLSLDHLAAGDCVFADDGSMMLFADAEEVAALYLADRTTRGPVGGPWMGLSPRLLCPDDPAAACVGLAEGLVLHATAAELQVWTGAGVQHRIPLDLSAAPLAVARTSEGDFAVWTPKRTFVVDASGRPTPLRGGPPPAPVATPTFHPTPAGAVYVAPSGCVVALGGS